MDERKRNYNEWLADRASISDNISVDNSRENIIKLAMTDLMRNDLRLSHTVILTNKEAALWMVDNPLKIESISDPSVINLLIDTLRGAIDRSDGLPKPTIDRMTELIGVLQMRKSQPQLAPVSVAAAGAAPVSVAPRPQVSVAPRPQSVSVAAAAPVSDVDPRLSFLMDLLEQQKESMSNQNYLDGVNALRDLYKEDQKKRGGSHRQRTKNTKKFKKSRRSKKSRRH